MFVDIEQLGSHLTGFYQIWYLNILRRYVEKIQVSLKSDNNNRYFTWRPLYGSHLTGFYQIWYLNILRRYVEKIQVSLKSDNNNRYFTWKPLYAHLWYLAEFFLERKMCWTKVIEKIKTECQNVLYDKLYINVNVNLYKPHTIWCKTRSRPPPQTPIV